MWGLGWIERSEGGRRGGAGQGVAQSGLPAAMVWPSGRSPGISFITIALLDRAFIAGSKTDGSNSGGTNDGNSTI